MTEPKKSSRQASWQRKHRTAGLCERCAEVCEVNPRTNKPYVLCERHRQMKHARQRAKYAKIKQQGETK